MRKTSRSVFVPIPLPTVTDYFHDFGVLQIVDLVFYPDLPSAWISRHSLVGFCCRKSFQVLLWAVNLCRKNHQQLRQSCLEDIVDWSNSLSSGKHVMLYCIFLLKMLNSIFTSSEVALEEHGCRSGASGCNSHKQKKKGKTHLFFLFWFLFSGEKGQTEQISPHPPFPFPSLSVKRLLWRLWEYVNIKQHFRSKVLWRITGATAHSFFLSSTNTGQAFTNSQRRHSQEKTTP